MMSNHHHTSAYDRYGKHVEFREHFHKLMAKSQNALRGRWENMWSTEEPCIVKVIAAEDLLNQLVEVEDQCARERMQSGRRVVGRRYILRQSWRDSPTSHEPRSNLRPRIAARSKPDRIAALERNKQW